MQISEMGEEALREMEHRCFVEPSQLAPKVYCRRTNNRLEPTIRFVCRSYGIREIKDAVGRGILEGFDEAGIPLASTTIEIVN